MNILKNYSILSIFLLHLFSVQAVLWGEVISCGGWSLNKFTELKKFLKGGEAQQYENLLITYVKGKRAVLTIYNDHEVVEKIKLTEYNDREVLHNLMAEKGFVKKAEGVGPDEGVEEAKRFKEMMFGPRDPRDYDMF